GGQDMSEDAILDALDRMITGFKPQPHTPDQWTPTDHLKTQVVTEKPSIPAPVATVATVATEKQALYGEEEDNDHHDAPSPSNFFEGSHESYIEFVTGGDGAPSGHSRTNLAENRDHLKSAGGHWWPLPHKPSCFADRTLARAE